MSISEKLEAIMKASGISRYRLAKETKIPYTTLTQILNGRTKDPQVSALQTIADYFNKPLDYLLGKSIGAVIEDRLKEKGMTMNDLSEQTKIPLEILQNLDNNQPAPWDYESDGVIDRISKVLDFRSRELYNAFARKEPPTYDGPRSTPESDFLKEEAAQYNYTKNNSPDWATSKDLRDFKKMLEEDAPVMFDGVPLEQEDKEKVLKVMEAIFWDAKKKNKRKPIE